MSLPLDINNVISFLLHQGSFVTGTHQLSRGNPDSEKLGALMVGVLCCTHDPSGTRRACPLLLDPICFFNLFDLLPGITTIISTDQKPQGL